MYTVRVWMLRKDPIRRRKKNNTVVEKIKTTYERAKELRLQRQLKLAEERKKKLEEKKRRERAQSEKRRQCISVLERRHVKDQQDSIGGDSRQNSSQSGDADVNDTAIEPGASINDSQQAPRSIDQNDTEVDEISESDSDSSGKSDFSQVRRLNNITNIYVPLLVQ